MKPSTVSKNGVSQEIIDLINRLIEMIPWPNRRSAMGDVALSILSGKPRVAEDVFGWGRETVELGMNEFRTKIICMNDLTARQKPKTEDKHPKLLSDIVEIMTLYHQAGPSSRPSLVKADSYPNLTAKAVYGLLLEKGWSDEQLPTVRTISNILNRHEYRLHSMDKAKVQKNRRVRTRSSRMSQE